MSWKIDLSNKVFGRLTVIEQINTKKGQRLMWKCRCECGNETVAYGNNITSGKTKSCGCLNKEVITKHGKSGSITYGTWQKMKDRCCNPNHKGYKDYGGRGIRICDQWLNSFDNFIADMGERPSAKHTLDRWPNVHGNYEPGNCRWATEEQQKRNRTNNIWFEYNGERLILNDLARKLNIPISTVRDHYLKGENVEQMIVHYSQLKMKRQNAIIYK